MKKSMLYIMFVFLGIHVILSCVMNTMRNNFALAYQQKTSDLEALKFTFLVHKDGYTWLVEGDGENIHVNFQGKMSLASKQTYFDEGLKFHVKIDPSIIQTNMEKAICNIGSDGQEYCNMYFDVMEIEGELYQQGMFVYKDQSPSTRMKGTVVDTLTISAKEEDKPIRVNVFSPSKEFRQDEIEVQCYPTQAPESLVEEVKSATVYYSNGLNSSFQTINNYYVYATDKSLIRANPSLYDISSDLSGVYKIDGEHVKKVFSFDPREEAYSLIDEIDDHLLLLKKDKEENVSLVSYDTQGNFIDTYSLENKEMLNFYYDVDDQLFMIEDLQSRGFGIYAYQDQVLTQIDEFSTSYEKIPEVALYTYTKYYDGNIYKLMMHEDMKAFDVAIYDHEKLIHQNQITGSMLADMNHFAQPPDMQRNSWENMMYMNYANDSIGDVTFHMKKDE